jgi:hypothetical protein
LSGEGEDQAAIRPITTGTFSADHVTTKIADPKIRHHTQGLNSRRAIGIRRIISGNIGYLPSILSENEIE